MRGVTTSGFAAALLAPAAALAGPTALVVPLAKVPGISDATALAMTSEIADGLRRRGWEVDGPGVARDRLPAGCPPADFAPGPGGGPPCACSNAYEQEPRRALVVAGKLTGTIQVTLALAAYGSGGCMSRATASVQGEVTSLAAAQDLARRAADDLASALRGRLVVRATPAAAEILVAGTHCGAGTCERDVAEGSYEIEVRLDGYTTERRTVEVAAADDEEVEVELVPVSVPATGAGPGPATGGGQPPSGVPGAPWTTYAGVGLLGAGIALAGVAVANATQIGDEYDPTFAFWFVTGAAAVSLGTGVVLLLSD